ncbi:unnamed protein product [Cunninghamella blakesleeana]
MKESSQPKALNILRPNQPISSAKSTTSSSSNVIANRKPRVTSYITANNDKPSLNIYHPSQKTSSRTSYNGKLKSKKSSNSINSSVVSNSSSVHSQHYPYTSSTVSSNSHYLSNSSNISKDCPSIEIYKPGMAQLQRPTPVIISTSNSNNNINNSSSNNSSSNYINNGNNNNNSHSESNNNKTNINSKHYTATTAISSQNYRNITNNSPQLYHITTNSNSFSSISVDHQNTVTSPTRISISQSSSTSTASSENSQKNYIKRQVTNDEIEYISTDDEEDQKEDDNHSNSSLEENILNEARVNRKIADLEISNESLLHINEMLEETLKKQTAEMAKLKKRIKFGDNGDNNDDANLLLNNELIQPLPSSDLSEDEWENDKSFQKLCKMMDDLIEQAQSAVKFEYKGAGRVLSRYNNDNEENENNDHTEDGNNG